MRESIGLSYIVGFIVTFTAIFIFFFAGSLAYSKAFKVKNKIINIIEEAGGYSDSGTGSTISYELSEIGYRVSASSKNDCPSKYGTNLVKSGDYHYCVYGYNTKRGRYYKVITYMYFDFPIIGSHLEFPVSGETKVLGDIFE